MRALAGTMILVYFSLLFCKFQAFAISSVPSICAYISDGPPPLTSRPIIPWYSFERQTELPSAMSGGSLILKHAYFQHKKVFLKVSSATRERGGSSTRSPEDVANEVYWFDTLRPRGWSPELYGLSFYERPIRNPKTRSQDVLHHYVLATDFVEGRKVGHYEFEHNELPLDFVTAPSALNELEDFYAFMEENQIYPKDLQIILKRDGTWKLIDPEWYQPIIKLTAAEFAKFKKKYEAEKRILFQYFTDHLERR